LDEQDNALPDPPLWRVIKASAPEWYLLVVGVIGSAVDGVLFPILAVFLGRALEVCICVCDFWFV